MGGIVVAIRRTIPRNAIELLLLDNFYTVALTDTPLCRNADRNSVIGTDIVPEA